MGQFDLKPVIEDAIRRFGGGPAGAFSSAAFALAVKARFDLADAPDDDWCARVLSAEPGVVRFGGHTVWRLARAGEVLPCP